MSVTVVAKKRILKLCEYLESLPPAAEKHFDMVNWLGHKEGRKGKHKHFDNDELIEQKHLVAACGTTACALGWATTSPYFRKLGLSMRTLIDADGDLDVVMQFGELTGNGPGVFDVAKEAFELSGREAEMLFRDLPASTPKQWAQNARQWIKQQERLS